VFGKKRYRKWKEIEPPGTRICLRIGAFGQVNMLNNMINIWNSGEFEKRLLADYI